MTALACVASGDGSFWAGLGLGVLLGAALPAALDRIVDAWARLARRHGG